MILMALNAIATEHANPTTKTILRTKQFFHYMAMNDEAIVRYQASDMILAVHSNVSYLSKLRA